MKTQLVAFAILGACFISHAKNLSLKNFREIYASYQVALNVTPDTAIKAQYQAVVEFLPKTGIVEEYTSAMQLGLIKLAGDFCQARVKADAALSSEQRWLHKGIDFSKAPDTLSAAQKTELFKEYSEVFLQRALNANEEKALQTSYGEMAKTTTQMQNFLTYFCVAFSLGTDFLII